MARPPVDRSKPEPWTPGAPPAPGSSLETITRAYWDELQRLSVYLASLDPDALALALHRRSRRP